MKQIKNTSYSLDSSVCPCCGVHKVFQWEAVNDHNTRFRASTCEGCGFQCETALTSKKEDAKYTRKSTSVG